MPPVDPLQVTRMLHGMHKVALARAMLLEEMCSGILPIVQGRNCRPFRLWLQGGPCRLFALGEVLHACSLES